MQSSRTSPAVWCWCFIITCPRTCACTSTHCMLPRVASLYHTAGTSPASPVPACTAGHGHNDHGRRPSQHNESVLESTSCTQPCMQPCMQPCTQPCIAVQTADEENAAVGLRRLLGTAAPESLWLVLAVLMSALVGAVRPLLARLLATSVALILPTTSAAEALRISMFFVALAASQLVLGTLQVRPAPARCVLCAARLQSITLPAPTHMSSFALTLVLLLQGEAGQVASLLPHAACCEPVAVGITSNTVSSMC